MNFFEEVYRQVLRIPAGQVATYGQIAHLAGSPRAARQVGFALNALKLNEQRIPWWRVVNKQGYLSINHGEAGMEKILQRDLLEAEGVEINEKLEIDLEKFLWTATSSTDIN